MKSSYRTLPRKWVKALVEAVRSDPSGYEASRSGVGRFRGELSHITVVINHRKFYCREAHDGSYYFSGYENNAREIRVSNHWVCRCSKKVNHYEGYACIPEIDGKIETYKGFAAVMY